MPVMLKMLPPLLLLAVATSASAATYDPCAVEGEKNREIAQARDNGVMLSTYLIDLDGKFENDAEQELYFRRAAQIFLYSTSTPEQLRSVAFFSCNAEF
jgi:hypothetical protein